MGDTRVYNDPFRGEISLTLVKRKYKSALGEHAVDSLWLDDRGNIYWFSHLLLCEEREPIYMSKEMAQMIGKAVGMRSYNFDKNDWAHMHDCVLHASGISFSQEELETLFLDLPEEMRLEAELHGMNDTVWRDNLIKWFETEASKTQQK